MCGPLKLLVIDSEIEYFDIKTKDEETQTESTSYCTSLSHWWLDKAQERLTDNDQTKSDEVLTFLRLDKDGNYSLDNIAFLLFLETVKFFL